MAPPVQEAILDSGRMRIQCGVPRDLPLNVVVIQKVQSLELHQGSGGLGDISTAWRGMFEATESCMIATESFHVYPWHDGSCLVVKMKSTTKSCIRCGLAGI